MIDMKTISKVFLAGFLGFFLSIYFSACSNDSDEITEDAEEVVPEAEDYSDWTVETHSNDVDPNYDVVFDDKSVMCIGIVIDSDKWASMQSNLYSIFGNSSGGQMGPGGGGMPGGGINNNSVNGFTQNTTYEDPEWQDCSIYYYNTTDTIEWYHVGVRYKGNSSLQNAYQSGSKKLSFKLDFDQYEEDYPDLKNQRFYGFKQLNISNNFLDNSCMREKVAADLFRSFGVPASHTRFCVLYVNHGEGNEFYGIYAIVEEVDDTVLADQFGNDDGNLYKPEGDAASFGENTYDKDELIKKNNEDESDYTDVSNLYKVLNEDDTRTNDTTTWKSNLEEVLNVPEFLKWLSANTVIQNWDTYGNMTHNYYLYNNDGRLNWIPWDNNEAFEDEKGCLSLSLSGVADQWPLINYLMEIDSYKAIYKKDLQDFIDNVYSTTYMNSLYDTYYDLLKKYASDEGNNSFSSAVSTLRSHVSSRKNAVEDYLME